MITSSVTMTVRPLPSVRVSYDVPPWHERWALEDDVTMPETPLHERIIDLLKMILRAWVAREGRDAMVGSNIALRWNRAHPRVGVDPDVYLVEPAPPGGERIQSLRLWERGHVAPRIAVEIVSGSNPGKDYGEAPEKYAASGVRELWVFDPLLKGPPLHGGPHLLQIWRRTAKGAFRRVYAGTGPALSRELGIWLVVTEGGTRLRLAQDAAGAALWPTEAEAERSARQAERVARQAEMEAERAAKEAERAAKEAERVARRHAEAEVRRLRRLLAKSSPNRGRKSR
jgi:Uma2 family endonuclease